MIFREDFLRFLTLLTLLMGLTLCGCSNFEELRKEKFEPDYATKYPTTFLKSKELNGRFVKHSLGKDQPLMLLKKGLGYSVYQLHGGDIGEVANEAIRPKKEGEMFTASYTQRKPREDNVLRFGNVQSTFGKIDKIGKGVDGHGEDGLEKFPILNNSLKSVEPELPDWE